MTVLSSLRHTYNFHSVNRSHQKFFGKDTNKDLYHFVLHLKEWFSSLGYEFTLYELFVIAEIVRDTHKKYSGLKKISPDASIQFNVRGEIIELKFLLKTASGQIYWVIPEKYRPDTSHYHVPEETKSKVVRSIMDESGNTAPRYGLTDKDSDLIVKTSGKDTKDLYLVTTKCTCYTTPYIDDVPSMTYSHFLDCLTNFGRFKNAAASLGYKRSLPRDYSHLFDEYGITYDPESKKGCKKAKKELIKAFEKSYYQELFDSSLEERIIMLLPLLVVRIIRVTPRRGTTWTGKLKKKGRRGRGCKRRRGRRQPVW